MISQYTPLAIETFLDYHVVGQKSAKKALSVALFTHMIARLKNGRQEKTHENRVILLIGPSGSGKTLLALYWMNLTK